MAGRNASKQVIVRSMVGKMPRRREARSPTSASARTYNKLHTIMQPMTRCMTNPIIPTLFHQDRILLVAKLQGLYLTSRDMSGAPHNEHAMCVRITHAPWPSVGPTRDDRRNQARWCALALCANSGTYDTDVEMLMEVPGYSNT